MAGDCRGLRRRLSVAGRAAQGLGNRSPGLGESAPSNKGYDTATISRILKESLSAEAGKSYHLVGHDIGAWIAYAWASQFPEELKSLTLLDSALPRLASAMSFPLSFDLDVEALADFI